MDIGIEAPEYEIIEAPEEYPIERPVREIPQETPATPVEVPAAA